MISGFSSPELALLLSEESAVQSRPNAGAVSQHLSLMSDSFSPPSSEVGPFALGGAQSLPWVGFMVTAEYLKFKKTYLEVARDGFLSSYSVSSHGVILW